MEKKSQININILTPIILLIISITIPLINGTLGFFGFIKFFGVFVSSFCVGLIFLDFLKIRYSMKGEIIYNMSFYIGLIFFAPLLVLQTELNCNVILYLSILLSLLLSYFYFKRRLVNFVFDLKYQFPIITASLLTLMLFANFREIISVAPIMYKNHFQDFYWFTAMTSSIRDFDFSNSNFEEGVGVYHHVLGLFPASYISALTNLSSHTALWSISMPLVIFTAFSSLVFIIEQFFNNIKTTHLFLTLTIFLLHFPLNPKCFFNGNLNESIWLGSGHTLPVLPTWAAVYCLSLLLIVVILKSKQINIINVLVVSLLTFLLAWAKITSIVVFYPFIIIFLLLIERKIFTSRQRILLFSVVPILFLMKFYYSNSSAKFIFEPGQIIIDNLKSTNTSPYNYFLALIISFTLVAIWIGIKWLLLFNSSQLSKKISFSFLTTIVFCILLQLVLKIKSFDNNGHIMDDSSYDIQQFMRSTFIYIDVFALLLFFNLLQKVRKSKIQLFAIIALPTAYSLVIVLILFSNVKFYFPNYFPLRSRWETEVLHELENCQSLRKAMISDHEFSGQFISAHDIDNFYLSIENRNGGYTYSYINSDKYHNLKEFITGKSSREYLKYLQKNHVQLLIATPNTIQSFNKLEKKMLVNKYKDSKWLFTPRF